MHLIVVAFSVLRFIFISSALVHSENMYDKSVAFEVFNFFNSNFSHLDNKAK